MARESNWTECEFMTLLYRPELDRELLAQTIGRSSGAIEVVREGIHIWHRERGNPGGILSKMMARLLEEEPTPHSMLEMQRMVLVCKTIWEVKMKWILVPILVIGILLLCACAAPSAPPPAPAPTPAPPPTPPPTPEPIPEPRVTTEWITPISAEASGYTVWGETWYTGPPELAIDGNDITAWTLDDMGEITFDLGSKRLVAGIEAYWGGHVTNGNTVNVFVDNTQVLHNERFGATTNERSFNLTEGRYIKYQTVPLPHNEFLQVATWSEVAEFKVLVESE